MGNAVVQVAQRLIIAYRTALALASLQSVIIRFFILLAYTKKRHFTFRCPRFLHSSCCT